MARGAQAGATVGAIGGAIEGSGRESAKKDYQAQKDQRELQQIRRDIGDSAFDGVVALVDCKHGVAVENAKVAAQSTNSNHALAGLWLQALSHADRDGESGLDEMSAEIIRWDRQVPNRAQFDSELWKAHNELLDIRSENKLPRTCSS